MAGGARDVFVNCAFDLHFQPIFRAIIFAVHRSGFQPRCALEVDDSSESRFAKIQNLIEECPFGIHDLSRTEVDGAPPLPRFNMPLELGLFLGAKRFGDEAQRKKRALVLDIEPYRYQRFISDLAGQDIHAHDGNPAHAIEAVVTWLRTQSRLKSVPGGRRVAEEFADFQQVLPSVLAERRLHVEEMTFGDFSDIVSAYLTESGR